MLIDGFKTTVAHARLRERRKAQREREAKALLEEGFAGLPVDDF
jgi:hypothetical protein